jgi:hypothetical protein
VPRLMLNVAEAAVREAVMLCGEAFVKTDMWAHRNPTRMAAIERATRDLVRRFFIVVVQTPTIQARSELRVCHPYRAVSRRASSSKKF